MRHHRRGDTSLQHLWLRPREQTTLADWLPHVMNRRLSQAKLPRSCGKQTEFLCLSSNFFPTTALTLTERVTAWLEGVGGLSWIMNICAIAAEHQEGSWLLGEMGPQDEGPSNDHLLGRRACPPQSTCRTEIRMNWMAWVDFFFFISFSSTSNEGWSSTGGPFSGGSGSCVLLWQMVALTGGRPDWR